MSYKVSAKVGKGDAILAIQFVVGGVSLFVHQQQDGTLQLQRHVGVHVVNHLREG